MKESFVVEKCGRSSNVCSEHDFSKERFQRDPEELRRRILERIFSRKVDEPLIRSITSSVADVPDTHHPHEPKHSAEPPSIQDVSSQTQENREEERVWDSEDFTRFRQDLRKRRSQWKLSSRANNEDHIPSSQDWSEEQCSEIKLESIKEEGKELRTGYDEDEQTTTSDPATTTGVQDNSQDEDERNREEDRVWSSQELASVAQDLRVRRLQVKRLMMAVIRKRQMEHEPLLAFKKRIRRL